MTAAPERKWLELLISRLGDIIQEEFTAQAKAILDRSQYQAWVCGRRSGKTTGLLRRVLITSMLARKKTSSDDVLIAYVAPTKNQAKRLIWDKLQSYTRGNSIEADYNNTELVCRIGDAQIWVMGADNDRDVDRLRGFAYRLVVIDEAQSVTADLDNLVNDVISPALADYRGRLILAGTPGPSCMGYLHDVSTSTDNTWSRHHWTVLDNPLFPAWRNREDWRGIAEKYLDEIRRARGWSADDPTYLREWMGRWARDDQALVYAYDPTRNDYSNLPSGHQWHHVIGVDFGMDDAFALVVWAFAEDHRVLYQVDEYSISGKTVSDWARIISDRIARWSPMMIVADSGGLGKAIISEMVTRFSLPIVAAEKKNKAAYIEVMNSDLRSGRVMVKHNSQLGRTWLALEWAPGKKLEDPRTPNDISDAALYSYREALHWMSREKPAVVEDPSVAIERKMYDNRMRELRRKQKRG